MEELPYEMICHILKYLDIESAMNMSLVNKFFRETMHLILLIGENKPFVVTSKTRYYLFCRKYEIREDLFLDPNPNGMCSLNRLKRRFADRFITCSDKVTNMLPFELCKMIVMAGCKNIQKLGDFKKVAGVDMSNTGLLNFKPNPFLKAFGFANNEARINFEGFPKRMSILNAMNNCIDEIKSVEDVEQLQLDDNLLTNLGSIKKVKHLSINNNYITTLSGLPNLEALNANYTDLVTLDLDTPKTLKHLEISGTRLPNLNMLIGMSNLLHLKVNNFPQSIKAVEYLTSLITLKVVDSGLIEEYIDVSNLTNLKVLSFSRNVVGFEKLSRLVVLLIDVRLLQFQDILDKLKLLTNLKYIELIRVERPEIVNEVNLRSYLPDGCEIICQP